MPTAERRAGAVQRQLAFALSAPLVLMWQLRAAARRREAVCRDARLEHGAHGAVRRSRGAARRARARCWALDVDCAQALHDSPRGRIMRVRLPHGLRIGACERPAAAGWGDGVCVSQSRTFFTSSSLVVCGCSRARFCARPRAAQKVAPSLAHLSGAPKQPLDGGDGGCGAHKGALGAYHPTTSHRGWSAPSVRSAAVGRAHHFA